MASATPSVPNEASEQRFGPGAAAAPLALLDATLEPSEPPPAVQLQVGAAANAVMCAAHLMPICLPCHASDSLRFLLSRTGTDRYCCRHLPR